MSWDLGILSGIQDSASQLMDAYTEREVERVKPEPVNTANEPKQNPEAPAIKYSATAATETAANQAAAATAATPKADFLSKYGKWLAVGGGTVAVLGVLIIASKGGK